MTEVKLPKKFSWTLVAVSLAALVVGATIPYVIADTGVHGKLKIESLGIEVELWPDDDFSSLFQGAIDNDKEKVERILASHGYHNPSSEGIEPLLATHGYYSLSSDTFLEGLAKIDPLDERNKSISDGLKRMLANLEGPFRLPGTFLQADEKLMQAFDALDDAMADAQEANALLAELWEQNLEQRGVFRQREFPATIELVKHAPEDKPLIYTCSGGALVSGRIVDIFNKEDGTSIKGEISHDLSLLDCKESVVDTRTLLKGKIPVQLGLSRMAYDRLYPSRNLKPSTELRKAEFVVYPRHLVAAMRERK